jgi:hypothetical protein
MAKVGRHGVSGTAERVLPRRQLHVVVHHHGGELLDGGAGLPAQLGSGLGGVAEQHIHLSGAHISRVEGDRLLDRVAQPRVREGHLGELTDADRAPRRDDIVRRRVLQHGPHGPDVVARKAPVAPGIEVAEVHAVLQAVLDAPDGPRDLPGHERLATPGRLMVEHDAATHVHAVGLAVVHRQLVRHDLGARIRAARAEGRLLGLRRLDHLAVLLAGGSLVEADFPPDLILTDAHGFQHLQRAHGDRLGGVHRQIEGHTHVRLRTEVVHLVRPDRSNEAVEAVGIAEIAVVQRHVGTLFVRVVVQVLDAISVERGRAADDAMDLIALGDEQFGQVAAVLPGDARDQRPFHLRHRCSCSGYAEASPGVWSAGPRQV